MIVYMSVFMIREVIVVGLGLPITSRPNSIGVI